MTTRSSCSACVPRSKRNARVSTSPITASAPTICEFSPGAISQGRTQNYGSGTYPAMPRPSRGSSASWGPFLFLEKYIAFSVSSDLQKAHLTPYPNHLLIAVVPRPKGAYHDRHDTLVRDAVDAAALSCASCMWANDAIAYGKDVWS